MTRKQIVYVPKHCVLHGASERRERVAWRWECFRAVPAILLLIGHRSPSILLSSIEESITQY